MLMQTLRWIQSTHDLDKAAELLIIFFTERKNWKCITINISIVRLYVVEMFVKFITAEQS